MSGHTPGPWLVCPTNNGTFVKSEQVAGYLAEVRHCRTTQDVNADARLIAAAPELLEALIEVRKLHQRYYDRVGASDAWAIELQARVKSALAKATGEQP